MMTASGGIILSEDTSRILLQLRAAKKRNKNYWGFWGGSSNPGELPVQTLRRELHEELGNIPDITKIYPMHKLISNDKHFEYNTFVVTVPHEFIPNLNNESLGYAWVDYDQYPNPLHPGARIVLENPKLMSKIKTIVDQLNNTNS